MPSHIQKAHRVLRRGYHGIRQSDPMWNGVLNRQARRAWADEGHSATDLEDRIVDELHRDGITFSSLDELFPGADSLQRLREHAAACAEGPDELEDGGTYWKDAIVRFLDGGGETYPHLDLATPGISECLSDTTLRIAGRYLGSAPKFHGYSLQQSRVVSDGAERIASQNWHRDPHDRRILKMFVYITDVPDEGLGPFEYVRGSQDGGRWRDLFGPTPPIGRYPPDGAIEGAVPADDIATCLGDAGTVIFADTTGLHRGSYSTAAERIMFTGFFLSAASTFPRNYVLDPGTLTPDLPPLVRYALG